MSEEQVAPETRGVTVKLLATVDLGPEIEGMTGRHLMISAMRTTTSWLLLAAAALATASCSGPRGSTGEARADSPGTAAAAMRVSNNGVFIDHRSCGRGDTTLLFVHGWAIDQTYWSNQMEEFCPEYHVVTFDLPGFGKSGKNREAWTVANYASDVRAVIDQLHLDNVVLIGHSMAGDIMLEAALDNDKVLALVGVDNFKRVGVAYTDDMRTRIADFIHQLRANFDATAVAYVRKDLFQPTTDTTVRHRVTRSVEDVDPAIATATLKGVFEYAPREAERLSELKKPLYLINSSATPTDTAALRSTGVAFEVFDVGPTGHYPMVEDPQAFNSLLREVLRDIGAGTLRQ